MEVGARRPKLHAPAFRIRRGVVSLAVGKFPAPGVFREGAENSARGGRAPISISVFGSKPPMELREGWDYAEGGDV